MKLKFKMVKPDAVLPGNGQNDLCSIIAFNVPAQDMVAIPTGLSVSVPPGFILTIAPKRSIAEKSFVEPVPGVVHPGSTEEIIVILKNHGLIAYHVEEGAPIAQVFLMPAVSFASEFVVSFGEL